MMPGNKRVCWGDTTLDEFLIKNPDVDDDGRMPLMVASIQGLVEIVKVLLARPETKINARNCIGDTALIMACKNCEIEVVKLLLKCRDIKLDVKYNIGFTALAMALRNNRFDIAKLLLAHGAKIPPKDSLLFGCYKGFFSKWKSFLLLPGYRGVNARVYPQDFKIMAKTWLLVCLRFKMQSKDLRYLILDYIAKAWKRG